MRNYSTIIFDLDDTLWDTRQNSKEALCDIYNSYGLDRFYENYDDFYVLFLTLNESLWKQYNHGHISKDELQNTRFRKLLSTHSSDLDFRQMNEDFIDTTCTKTKLIDGAHEILSYLSAKYKLTILSNSFEKALRAKVCSSGFDKYFDQIYSSELIGINKPDPRAFDFVMKEQNGSKNNSIMIGDNLSTDIEGAQNSGIDQIWFNPEAENHFDKRATYTIRSLFEIKEIL